MISGCLIIFIYMDLTLFQDEVRVLQGYRELKVDGNFKRHTLQHFAASNYIFCFVPRATEDKHHCLVEDKHRDSADLTGTYCRLRVFTEKFESNEINVTRRNATMCHKTLAKFNTSNF